MISCATDPRLTRAGGFIRGGDDALITPDGTPVLDARRRPMVLPDRGAIEVDETGTLSAEGRPIGHLWLVDPPRVEALVSDGGTRFKAPPALDLPPARNVHVHQGALEQANVNPVLTLVEMVDAMRVYEASQRAARGVDETLSHAVSDIARV